MGKQGKSSDSSKKSGGFLSRLVVIGFGLAMVILGSESLQKKHGGVMKYLKDQSRAFAAQVRSEGRNFGDEAPITTLDVGKGGKRMGIEAPDANHKPMDKLSDGDRNELNQLLNGL